MRDQATNLRAIVRDKYCRPSKASPGPRVIAVTSGKGGVGKTSLVVNLGITLAKLNQRVAVFDADLGLANVDVLLGVNPPYNLYDVLYGEKTIRDIIVQGPHGINVVSGSSGIQELANLDRQGQERLIAALSYFNENADFVLIDTGAGISRNVLGFVAAAEEVVVMVTPEPTSLTDAYSLVKVLATYKVHSSIDLVVNRAADEQEAVNTAIKFMMVTNKFLQIKINHIGSVIEDRIVGQAVKSQAPFVILKPNSVAASNILSIANTILGEQNEQVKGMGSFLGKLFRLFR
ncbi:MAG: MinD/ParA family protein [Firmicutes bacterium]|nr:MinD/ParA family protein [Bacillota bacterium]